MMIQTIDELVLYLRDNDGAAYYQYGGGIAPNDGDPSTPIRDGLVDEAFAATVVDCSIESEDGVEIGESVYLRKV